MNINQAKEYIRKQFGSQAAFAEFIGRPEQQISRELRHGLIPARYIKAIRRSGRNIPWDIVEGESANPPHKDAP